MIEHFIEFPKIGIRFEIDPVAFTVFGNEIYLYGIMIALGFALALILIFKNAKKFDIDTNVMSDLILVGTPSAIIFARLYYVVFEWGNYKNDLLQIFNLRNGGLAIYGGVIGAAISVFIYSKIKKIKVIKYLDFIAPYFIMAQAIGRFGNFFNQEAFGSNTSLPWGMTGDLIVDELSRLNALGVAIDPALNVHPTFFYEFLWNMLVFSILLYVRKKSKKQGQTVSAYMALYGFGRMFIEGLRMDSLMSGSIRVSQLLGLILFVGFGYLYYRITKGRKQKKIPIEPEEISSPFSELAKKIKEEEKNKGG